MSQPSLDAAATAYRRKMMAKTIGFAVLVAVIWLQPRIQAWLDGRKTGGSDVVVNHDADPSNTTQRPADRKRVIIKDVDESPVAKDVDESPVAEVDRLDSPQPTETTSRAASAPGHSHENSNADKSKTEKSQSDAEPVLGELREIRKNVFESTAGLRYVPGSADNHRLRHVMQHAKDDTTKPIHGVFEGDRDQILAAIDEAYQKAKKGGRDVHSEEQNDRLVFTVNLGRKIGYMGGSEGKRTGNPECRYVRIVLEDGNVVISAYPKKSF